MKIRPSIIGYPYWPVDNSFAYCLQDQTNYYLAGMTWSPQTKTLILSEPFSEIVDNWLRDIYREFIYVKCPENLIHKVLWFEHGLVKRENKLDYFIDYA